MHTKHTHINMHWTFRMKWLWIKKLCMSIWHPKTLDLILRIEENVPKWLVILKACSPVKWLKLGFWIKKKSEFNEMQNDLPMSNWNIFQAVHIVICIICKWLNIVWTQFNVCNKCVWWINTQAVNLNRWMESIFQFLHWIRDFHFFFSISMHPLYIFLLSTHIYTYGTTEM